MFGLGHTEIILVLAIIMVLFGAKKIPDKLKGIARGVKEFRKEIHSINKSITN